MLLVLPPSLNMRYQDIPIRDILEKMKERIGSNQMSLLVGSGVSCCACDLYQNWYGAQNEAYKCLLAENVANGLCFS